MGNVEFGALIRALRLERTVQTIDGRVTSWSQEYLAERTQLSSSEPYLSRKQIADLEQGNVVNVRPDYHIDPLVKAFGLNEFQKAELYSVAGHIYQTKDHQRSKEIINWLFLQHKYPSVAGTPLWDCFALDTYAFRLFAHSDETIQSMNQGVLRSNLLKVMFDPLFKHKQLYGGADRWREVMIRNLRAFRIVSFRYMATKRYQQIIHHMHKYEEFSSLWLYSQHDSSDDPRVYVQPTFTVFHSDPKLGKMDFMSLRVPQPYIGLPLIISIYLPFGRTEDSYKHLSDSVEHNKIYFFDILSLDEELDED